MARPALTNSTSDWFPGSRVIPLVNPRPAPPVPEAKKDYNVLISGCNEVGGVAAKDKHVRLTPAQAQFWIDQGVIGEQPGSHRPGDALKPAKKPARNPMQEEKK